MTFAGQDGARLGGEVFHAKYAPNKCKTAQKARIPMGFLGIFADSSGVFAPDECLRTH